MMNLWIKNTLVVMFFICMVTTASANEVSKSDWLETMSTALPTAFCQSHQYFRQCFKVTQIECEETASSATRICLEKHKVKIPDVLNQPKDGTHWGTIIGRCAGEAYGIVLQNKRIVSKKCNNPANWK